MTVPFDSAASGSAPHYGNPMFECGGAQMRAQCRPLATVVTVSGVIDDTNTDRVTEYSRRFILPDKPFVLDLSGVDHLAPQCIPFLHRVDEDCGAAGVEWALVASIAVTRALRIADDTMFPVAVSLHEALHHFADDISARRRLLLPLLSKTA